MPPYYYDCVTYNSPVVSMWQTLYAFGAGLIVASIISHLSEKSDPVAEHETMNAEQLREELKVVQSQLYRAFHVIAALLVGLWICGVSLALHFNIGTGTGWPSDKTEL
jgi:hypothetical protein